MDKLISFQQLWVLLKPLIAPLISIGSFFLVVYKVVSSWWDGRITKIEESTELMKTDISQMKTDIAVLKNDVGHVVKNIEDNRKESKEQWEQLMKYLADTFRSNPPLIIR